MKSFTQKLFSLTLLLILTPILVIAQTDLEKEIEQTALDYVKSIYRADAETLTKTIHPEITKASFSISNQSGRSFFQYSTYSTLIENTKGGEAVKDEEMPAITVDVLSSARIFANAKVTHKKICEYLQLVKVQDQWKVLTVLTDTIEKSAENTLDNMEVHPAVKGYVAGIIGGEAKRLEMSIFPEFKMTFLIRNPQTGVVQTVTSGSDEIIENSMSKIGVSDEPMRNYTMKILDRTEKTAVAEITMATVIEYVQLAKSNEGWKAFRCLRRGNPDYNFYETSPVYLDEPMPDFTLSEFNGKEFTLSEKKGKKVMLVFVRGWIGTIWCPLCHYQYLELAEYEKLNKLREKYNMEIAFVLPYTEERIEDWSQNFAGSIDIIEGWKALGDAAPDFSAFIKKIYPETYDVKDKEVELNLPVLIDADKKVSKRFKLATNFWDSISADQNIATIYILDEEGTVKFKYVSQQTQDRPSLNYLVDFIKRMD